MNENIPGTIEVLEKDRDRPFLTEVNGVTVLALPPDWTSTDLEKLLPHPKRVEAVPEFHDLDAFIGYVEQFADDNTVIWLRDGMRGFTLTAIIDYHEPQGQASWCGHKAVYAAEMTPAWSKWYSQNDELLRQADFAQFIYQNMAEIKNPAGAALLEIIQTLKATSKGEFRDMRNLHDGSVDLVYRTKVSAQGGTKEEPISLPEKFLIEVQPFYGVPSVELQADLVIRAPREDGDPLMLGYLFYRPEDVFQELVEKVRVLVGKQTKLPVYKGTG
jgi:uncharacterized protein YfdQ (DUF2303 family)